MKSKKSILIALALLLAACMSVAALAETPTETPANGTASDAAKAAAEAAQAASDAAKAENDALQEALDAYGKAKAESRKLAILTSLKEELDGYVAAGSLTQEQADLILKYYAEQLTNQQSGTGFERGGKGGRHGHNNTGTNQNGFGKGRRHDRFNNTQTTTESTAPVTGTEQPAGI